MLACHWRVTHKGSLTPMWSEGLLAGIVQSPQRYGSYLTVRLASFFLKSRGERYSRIVYGKMYIVHCRYHKIQGTSHIMTHSYHLYGVRGTKYSVEGRNLVNMKQGIYSCSVLGFAFSSVLNSIYFLRRPDYMS